MNEREHLLVCLSEEANEISHACHKALRFGLDHAPHGKPLPNDAFILYEVDDLLAVLELLQEQGVIPVSGLDRKRIEAKKAKVVKHMELAVRLGTLEYN